VNREAFVDAATSIGLPLSKQQVDQFQIFEDHLYKANEVMNLTRVPQEECWLRHFLDSLLFHDLIPAGASLLDIGTGPGFPAWPIACVRPDVKVSALDSSGKMLGFLQKNPLPNLTCILDRAEEWAVRNKFDVVTGRALAPLETQLELSATPCKANGCVIPMRTPSDEEAIKKFVGRGLGLKLERVVKRSIPGTDVVRVFPIFRKVGKAHPNYPRSWGEMKRNPLQ